jgi:hypothetical protein
MGSVASVDGTCRWDKVSWPDFDRGP